MITTEGALRILDFGLARVLSEATQLGLTGAGMMIGTPYYMAPEQIQGKPVDRRTDIFSVGLVIYELLSGQRAFPGDSPYAVIYKVLNAEPEPIERLVPGIDPALAQLVRRASEAADVRAGTGSSGRGCSGA